MVRKSVHWEGEVITILKWNWCNIKAKDYNLGLSHCPPKLREYPALLWRQKWSPADVCLRERRSPLKSFREMFKQVTVSNSRGTKDTVIMIVGIVWSDTRSFADVKDRRPKRVTRHELWAQSFDGEGHFMDLRAGQVAYIRKKTRHFFLHGLLWCVSLTDPLAVNKYLLMAEMINNNKLLSF